MWSVPPSTHPRLAGRTWRRVAANAVFVLAACAVAAPDPQMLPAALCGIGPVRAASALLESYLLRGHRHRGVALCHLAGLLPALMMGTAPASGPDVGRVTAVIVYFVTTMSALCCLAVSAFFRDRRRGGVPPAPAESPWSLSSLPAMLWFNAVFLLATGLLIAPSMAAQESSSLTYGFAGGLMVGAFLRAPAIAAEWWLTGRSRHRTVYGVHLGAGVPTAVITAAMLLDPVSGTTEPAATAAGSAIGMYLVLCLPLFLAAVLTVAVLGRWGHRIRRLAPDRLAAAPHRRPARCSPPAAPPRSAPPAAPPWFAPPVTPARFSSPAGPAPGASRASATVAEIMPARAPAAVVTQEPDAVPAAVAQPARADKLRNEIAVALGIVVGLASLVQGFDSADPFRTLVLALAVGFIGLGILYGTAIRR